MFLFNIESPTLIIIVVLAAVLLFGAGRLPQLARSLGQSKKAFKQGMREAEEEDWIDQPRDHMADPPLIATTAAKPVSAMSDDELAAEMARRQAKT